MCQLVHRLSLHELMPVALPILLLSDSIVSCVVLPFSFSSRLMRTTAAEPPMNNANTGSRFLWEAISHPLAACIHVRGITDLEMM